MTRADDAAMLKRRGAIFRAGAGAEAAEPKPVFQGESLGSAESCTFYDGYASTHVGFVNPYRTRNLGRDAPQSGANRDTL